MPGFGNGPFGRGSFGGSRWSRLVFWESLPEVYRLQDEDQDNLLERYSDGIRPSFDYARAKAADYFDLRYPLACRTQYDEVVTLRLGRQIVQLGELEQRGLDGTVDGLGQFSSNNARFRNEDVGKELTVKGSAVEANNTTVVVSRVSDINTCLTEPALRPDAGPVVWELRPDLPVPADQITVRVQSGYVTDIFPGWILYDGSTEYEIVARRHFPADRRAKQQFVEQDGEDGVLLSGGLFQAASGTFLAKDIGKKLVVTGSSVEGNDGRYEIVDITPGSPQTVALDDTALVQDLGPLYWALLPRPELDIRARVPFRGVADQEGVDGVLSLPGALQTDTGAFRTDDAGKLVSIRGSQLGNDGIYEILVVTSPTSVRFTTAVAAAESGLVWEVRDYTGIGDTVQVQAHAPSCLQYLAKDFGIEIDTRESEDKQRKWVDNVAGWTNIKGTENAYEYVGGLAGFIVGVSKLYRIGQPLYERLVALGVADALVEFGESDPGRFGSDGKLTFDAGFVFTSDSAVFHSYDVGRQLILDNTSDPANLGMFTIGEVLSSTTVRFDSAASGIVTPDYGSGGIAAAPTIRWGIVRLYTTLAPLLPNYDDFVHSWMKQIIDWKGTGEFDIDKFCWEDDFDADIPVDLVSVTQTSVTIWEVVVQTPAGQPGSAEAISGVGQWQFLDKEGNAYYLESLPVDLGGGQFSFEVDALVQPADVGPEDPLLRYVCSTDFTCGFCGSNKLLLNIEVGAELATATGAEVENLLQRALDRMEQAKPLHVEFVVVFARTHDALLSLTASVEPHPDIGAILTAYLTPFFDDIEGDVQECDHGLYGSVEPIIT